MNHKQLNNYLAAHALLMIGKPGLNTICADVIMEDWNDFLDFSFTNCISIKTISWWEYCRINDQKVLGGGGPVDPRNTSYYWSELYMPDFTLDIPPSATIEQLRVYITQIIELYAPLHELWPAFTI